MKERPILMSTDSVVAILDGKTQTRRTAGLEEINKNPDDWDFMRFNEGGVALFWRSPETASNNPEDPDNIRLIKCPYGPAGQRLYVRETTWYYEGSRSPHYVATEQPNKLSRHFGKVKPSIHMFRKDARLFLQTTEVRAERVQDITEADAVREGFQGEKGKIWWQGYTEINIGELGKELVHQEATGDKPPDWMIEPHRMLDRPDLLTSARSYFSATWDWRYAKRGHGWDKNDWVWPISFKKID